MTQKQKDALKNLETAFARCHSLGICFFGMDENIHFVYKKALKLVADYTFDGGYSLHTTAYKLSEKENLGFSGTLNTKSAYIDSEGW